MNALLALITPALQVLATQLPAQAPQGHNIVGAQLAIGRLFWKKGDGAVIDGLGPDNLAARAQDMAGVLMRFQSGYLYHYAFVMLVGVAGLVTYFMMAAR